jgi:hypothetical protein
VSKPILPRGDDFEQWRRDVDRRLEALDRARRAPFTTQRGGAFVLAPEDLDPPALMRFGNFPDGDGADNYGVGFYDEGGSTVWATAENERGVIYPEVYAQWQVPTAQSISSGSFVTVAEVSLGALAHDCMVASAALVVPGGSTAEVRVHDPQNGITTNAKSMTASGNALLNWLHPYSVGWGDDRGRPTTFFLQWQVRLAAGAGPISAFPPRSLTFLNRRFAVGEAATAGAMQ